MRSFTEKMYSRRQFAPPASDFVNARVLAANTAELAAVPAGAAFVVFSSAIDFHVKFGDGTVVAAIPVADVADGSGSELNPEAREVPAGITHLSLISASAGVVTLAWYGA
jgi:hypothetical protein